MDVAHAEPDVARTAVWNMIADVDDSLIGDSTIYRSRVLLPDRIVFTRFASAADVSGEGYICATVTGFS